MLIVQSNLLGLIVPLTMTSLDYTDNKKAIFKMQLTTGWQQCNDNDGRIIVDFVAFYCSQKIFLLSNTAHNTWNFEISRIKLL